MQLLNNNRKLQQVLPLALAVCVFLGVAAYCYTDGFDFSPAPPPLPPARAASPLVPEAAPKSAPRAVAQVEPPKPEPGEPRQSEADVKTLHTFAAKQAQLEEIKLDVAIEEQQTKLNELRTVKAAPVVSHMPSPVSTMPMQPVPVLPPLPPLTSPPSAIEPASPDGVLPPIRRTSGLMAIQGMDGNLAAVFATGNGKKTVRVGDSIMGSKVRAINLDGVSLSSGKTITIGD